MDLPSQIFHKAVFNIVELLFVAERHMVAFGYRSLSPISLEQIRVEDVSGVFDAHASLGYHCHRSTEISFDRANTELRHNGLDDFAL